MISVVQLLMGVCSRYLHLNRSWLDVASGSEMDPKALISIKDTMMIVYGDRSIKQEKGEDQ